MQNNSIAPYPIELSVPDIQQWSEGNIGIPFLYQFESGVAGPHVMLNALTHGNEYCGAIALDELLQLKLRPRRGTLTVAFSNYQAFQNFDPNNPDASRFVDRDFNRVWTKELLDDPKQDCTELRRARQIRPVIDTVDLLLDLHSMHEKSDPLMLSGPLEKGIRFAKDICIPENIIVDAGHAEGRRLRDYSGFSDPESRRNALLVECGQHWERKAENIAKQCIYRFLTKTRCIELDDLPSSWHPPAVREAKVIKVTDAIVAHSMDFKFDQEFKGLEKFERAGSEFAERDGEKLTTPYDNCVLVMPSLRQLRPGVTVVRLGQLQPG